MSLQPGTAVGGDYTDWAALIAASPEQKVLVVARIGAYHPAEPAISYTGTNYPVTTDFLICSGARAGEAELGEKVIGGGITGALRGVKNPKAGSGLPLSPPVRPIGGEFGFTLRTKTAGNNTFVVADPPTAEEYAQISQVYADGQGWANAEATAARNAAAAQQVLVPPAPVQPAQVPADQAAQFAAWQAQQAAAQAPPAPAAPVAVPAVTPAGPPADAPWRVAG